MGCDASHMDSGIELPKKKQPIPAEALKFIADSQFEAAEKIGDNCFKEGRTLEAIDIYRKIIQANYVHDYEVSGLGYIGHAASRYEWFISRWYEQGKLAGKITVNPYDALSLAYCSIREKQEELDQGIVWYEEMLGQVESYSLYIGYANILANRERFDEAIKVYKKVIELKPTLINSYVSLALIYEYKRIEKPKAIEMANKIIAIEPDNMYARFILARNTPNVDEKIEKLKAIHFKNPEYVRATNEIGMSYGGVKKDYQQAISWYSKCIEATPEYSSCYNNIGVNLELQKLFPEALVYYFKACERDHNYKGAHTNASDIFDTLNFTDEQIEQEIKKYPNLDVFSFYHQLGKAYYDKKKNDIAIKFYLKALAINANFYKLSNSLGIVYEEIKDYGNAQKYYNLCIKQNPKFHSAYYNLGILYKQQGNIERAIEMYRRAVEINPRYSFAYLNMGNIYKNMQNYPQAIDCYKKAVESNSTYTLAQANLAICYLMTHKYRDAFDAFNRAKQLLPNDNNNLSQSNKAFLKQHLETFDKEGEKWRNNGEVNSQQKNILLSLISNYNQNFNHRPTEHSNNPALKPGVLAIIRLIYEDKFELKNIEQIFEKVKELLAEDEEDFHILPLLLIQYYEVNTIEKKRKAAEVEEQLQRIMSRLSENVASGGASPTKTPHRVAIKLKHFTPAERPAFNLTAPNTYEALSSAILAASEASAKNVSQFVDLVEDVRKRSNGIEFLTSIRVPRFQNQQFRALLLITQQVLREELTIERRSQILAKVEAEMKKAGPRAPLQNTIATISTVWVKQVTAILSERAKRKIATELSIADLCKGKVKFNSVEELSRAIEVADNICFLRKYEIIGLQNRLTNRQFKDVVLTIKLHESVFELHLTLSHDEVRKKMIEAMHQIENSALGCALGSYVFMSQGFSYPLTLICEDVERELADSQTEQDRKTVEAAKYLLSTLSERPK